MTQEPTVETVVQTGHYASVTDVTYSTDGNLIATASNDKTIKLWRAKDGKEIKTFLESVSSIEMVNIKKQLHSV